MMSLPFQYTLACRDRAGCKQAPDQQEEGHISVIQLEREPYECIVEARGYSFHLIFGSQINGNFLCIPTWHIGCEMASLDDERWNLSSLLQTGQLGYEESVAIISALLVLSGILRGDHDHPAYRCRYLERRCL